MSIDRLLLSQSVPDSPPSGHSFIYVDPDDGLLKEIDTDGNRSVYDKREEGDWSDTAVVNVNTSMAIVNTYFKYSKIGNLVILFFRFSFDENPPDAPANITGLPFTPDQNANHFLGEAIEGLSLATSIPTIYASVRHDPNRIDLRYSDSTTNGSATLRGTELANGTQLRGNVRYLTNDF